MMNCSNQGERKCLHPWYAGIKLKVQLCHAIVGKFACSPTDHTFLLDL